MSAARRSCKVRNQQQRSERWGKQKQRLILARKERNLKCVSWMSASVYLFCHTQPLRLVLVLLIYPAVGLVGFCEVNRPHPLAPPSLVESIWRWQFAMSQNVPRWCAAQPKLGSKSPIVAMQCTLTLAAHATAAAWLRRSRLRSATVDFWNTLESHIFRDVVNSEVTTDRTRLLTVDSKRKTHNSLCWCSWLWKNKLLKLVWPEDHFLAADGFWAVCARFRVNAYPRATAGSKVCLTGSCESLGQWSFKRAVQLNRMREGIAITSLICDATSFRDLRPSVGLADLHERHTWSITDTFWMQSRAKEIPEGEQIERERWLWETESCMFEREREQLKRYTLKKAIKNKISKRK